MTRPKSVQLFRVDELAALENKYPHGVSSQEVISIFQTRGVKLSEATFRKYVQLGLLPTSRRVGRKGKHRGSKGIYPVLVVRRINLIKRMMMEDMTLEQIRDSFLSVQNEMEKVAEALERLFSRISDRLDRLNLGGEPVQVLLKDVETTQKGARMLMKSFERIGSRLAVAGSPAVPTDEGGLK